MLGHVHGISFSGKRRDAFPSGHALHMGALASAAGPLPAGPRWAIGALSVSLCLTRNRRAGALGKVTSSPALPSVQRSNEPFVYGPAILTRSRSCRYFEDLKEYAERVTGLRRPGK